MDYTTLTVPRGWEAVFEPGAVASLYQALQQLSDPQVSFDDAEARASHAVCSYCCLRWSTFTGRLGI
jgi:hypothetical protein